MSSWPSLDIQQYIEVLMVFCWQNPHIVYLRSTIQKKHKFKQRILALLCNNCNNVVQHDKSSIKKKTTQWSEKSCGITHENSLEGGRIFCTEISLQEGWSPPLYSSLAARGKIHIQYASINLYKTLCTNGPKPTNLFDYCRCTLCFITRKRTQILSLAFYEETLCIYRTKKGIGPL